MKTTIQVGFMGGHPQAITVDHQLPLSQDWLDRNGAVVLDNHATWCMAGKGCNCAATGKEVAK